MLGSDVVSHLKSRGWEVKAPTKDELNLTSASDLEKLRHRDWGNLDWVINCAAYTDVDKAQGDFFTAHAINGIAAGVLALISHKNEWRYLNVSTDYVFDGRAAPYAEGAEPRPANKYGQSKVMGEQNVRDNHPDAVQVRTSWLYGPHGKNFPRTMIRAWLADKELRVVDDQRGCPTYTEDLAEAIGQIIADDIPGGMYHAAGPSGMSWRDFAELSIRGYRRMHGLEKDVEIEGIPTSEWPTPAPRPLDTRLATAKLDALGITPLPSIADSLARFLPRLPAPDVLPTLDY